MIRGSDQEKTRALDDGAGLFTCGRTDFLLTMAATAMCASRVVNHWRKSALGPQVLPLAGPPFAGDPPPTPSRFGRGLGGGFPLAVPRGRGQPVTPSRLARMGMGFGRVNATTGPYGRAAKRKERGGPDPGGRGLSEQRVNVHHKPCPVMAPPTSSYLPESTLMARHPQTGLRHGLLLRRSILWRRCALSGL